MKYSFLFSHTKPQLKDVIAKRGFRYFLDSTALAEELGYDAVFISDHFMQPENITTFEPWTALSAIASKTEKIRLGSLVTPIPFYQPHVLAKRVAGADIISNGRVIFGVGSGWYEKEFEAYDTPFYDPKKRMEQTIEGLRLIKKLWTVDASITFDGKFYHLRDAEFLPKPYHKPHPPIWFGGSSTSILKAVAKYGDGWIPYEITPETMKHKISLLKKFAENEGRKFESFTIALSSRAVVASTKSVVSEFMRRIPLQKEWASPKGEPRRTICGTPDEILTQIQEYADVGVNHICLGILPADQMSNGLKLFWEEVASKFI